MTVAVKKKFSFRKTKDDSGKEVAAPAPIETEVQLLGMEDVVGLMNSGDDKILAAILDSLNTPILGYYRDLIDEVGVEKVRAEGIPPEQYSFQKIAYLPPASKSMFDDETWNAFRADYIEVLTKNGLDEPRAKMGADVCAGRLNRVKGNKLALEQFRDRIRVWFTGSERKEEMEKVYQYLITRCEEFIKSQEPEAVLASF